MLVSAIAGIHNVITTHQDIIWKTNAQAFLQGHTHHWIPNVPVLNSSRRVYYEDRSMQQLGGEPLLYSRYEQRQKDAVIFEGCLSEYVMTIVKYWHDAGQALHEKSFFRVIHRGPVSDQLAMKEFLPCDLQYAKVSLCPCGSSRGEEICTVHNKFVRWPVFGISPTDRAWSVHWPLLLPKSHIIEKVRLSKDLTIGSAHPKRKPISRTARLRALGAPLLYHEYIHPSVDLEENSYPALRGLTKDEMEALLKRDIQGHTCKMVLGVSENHIFDGCAIDFLNAYLLSLMEKIEQIILHSKLSLQTTGPGPMYVVPLFQDLAQTIVKSGLSGSTDHALTIVVPAFAASGLLPTAANPPPYCV